MHDVIRMIIILAENLYYFKLLLSIDEDFVKKYVMQLTRRKKVYTGLMLLVKGCLSC